MKKLIGIIAIAVCLVSSAFSLTNAEKAKIRQNIRNATDKELLEAKQGFAVIDNGGWLGNATLAYLLSEDYTLEEIGFVKSAVNDEYNRRLNPSARDKAKDRLLNKFDNVTSKIADKIYEDYKAVRKN